MFRLPRYSIASFLFTRNEFLNIMFLVFVFTHAANVSYIVQFYNYYFERVDLLKFFSF